MSKLKVEPALRPAALFLAAGVALTGIYFALPAGGVAGSVIYEGLGGLSALLIVWAVRRYRPPAAEAWILFALGNGCSVVGDILFDLQPNASSPSLGDGFYLASYPLLAAALLLLLFHAGGHHRIAAVADAGIATFAFVLFQWVFLMHPALRGGGSVGERAVAATYPAGDVVLLAGFAGFFVSPAWRKRSFWALVAAVLALVVGDEVYGLNPGAYSTGDAVDSTWMLSYVLFGVAALLPSMRELAQPRRSAGPRVSRSRIALLAAALLVPPAILLAQWAREKPLEVPAVFSAAVLIGLLVVWRLAGIMRALERLRTRERAARAEAVAAHEQLAEQNERLREADQLKDEFVALISHDLRTPLTSIIGYTELALEDGEAPLDPERRSYLEVVARSGERLLHIVDDLLFVARLQAGKQLELKPRRLDLAELAAQAVQEAQGRAQAKELTLTLIGSGPVPVEADKGRLFQLLDNLVANAIKFTPAGGSVEVAVERAGGGSVLEVRDTGIGLAPGEAERLFERFYRSSLAVEAQIPGTGLGLFIARAIAEAHGGQISAHGRAGGGTCFRVELPAPVGTTPENEQELVA